MHIRWHSRQDWKLHTCISIFHVTFPCLYKERKLNFWGDILASFDTLNIFICRYCTTCFEYLWYMCLFRELHAFKSTVVTGNLIVRFDYVCCIWLRKSVWTWFMRSLVLTCSNWLQSWQVPLNSWTVKALYIWAASFHIGSNIVLPASRTCSLFLYE